MGIIGLTNQPPRYPRIGALRKGDEKQKKQGKNGEYETWGDDLDYFRFTSDFPEVAAKFEKVYGKQPRSIRIFLPYETTDQNFPSAQKEYSSGGLVHSCDGKYIIRHRVGSAIVDVEGQGIPCPYKSERNPDGKIVPTAKVPGCKAQARLNVIIPDLQFGNVEVHTSSLHDIIRIDAQLRALESVRRRFGETLQGVPLILSRVQELISTPNPNTGNRTSRLKWLVHLTVQEEWGELLLQAMNQREMNAPQLVSGATYALASGVDFETGEIVDGFDGDFDDNEPPFVPEEFDETEAVVNTSPSNARPVEAVIAALHAHAQSKGDKTASAGQVKFLASTTKALCNNDEKMMRAILMHLFALESMKDATSGEASAIIDWGNMTKENNYTPAPAAISEAAAVYKAALIKEGQKELL